MRQRESAVPDRPIESAYVIISEDKSAVLIGTVAIWSFRPVQPAALPAESLASLQQLLVMLRKVPSGLKASGFAPYCRASSLNAFGIGAFALRHCPGEVPTISRKPRLKAG
jgi:hypothetical protein